MQCKCGGTTRKVEASSKKHDLLIEYGECSSCSRIGSETLYNNAKTEVLARGIDARRRCREVDLG